MTARRSRLLGVAAAVCAASWARVPPAHADQDRTVLATISFRALKDGAGVTDLKPNEVSLRLDNVAQPLQSLDLVRLDPNPAIAAPFVTNLGTDRRRDLVFVLDEESYQRGGEAAVREALLEMLRQLSPGDRAGLVSLHPGGSILSPTADRAAMRSAIAQVHGRSIQTESATDLSCRTKRLLPALSTLVDGLGADVTTTVLLFSSALAAPGAVVRATPGQETACLLLPEDFNEFRGAASRTAAQLYFIHAPDTLSGNAQKTNVGLERLAGEAAAPFFNLTGDPADRMKRIASDTAAFYVATIAVDRALLRTQNPTVNLRVLRDGITTRLKGTLELPQVETKTVSPRDMLRVATPFRALPLRAAGFPARNSAKNDKVVVLFEPAETSVSLTSAMAGLFNANGQLVAQWNAEPQDLASRPVSAGLIVEPGRYRLRVAAVDSKGRSGATDQDIVVELSAAGPVTTSAMVFGAAQPSGFSPRLQFTSSDAAGGVYLEIYGVKGCQNVSATADIAPAGQVTAIGRVAVESTPIDQSDGCILFGQFNPASLPSADYTMRIEIKLNGQTIGERVRSFRKALPPA